MARNLENSVSENSHVQEMRLRRSTRLNTTTSGAAPPPQVSTMGTTAVTTSVAIRGAVHGATTTARVVPPRQAQVVPSKAQGTRATSHQAQREPNALPSRIQASHSRASRTEQPAPVAQSVPMVSQAAQIGPRLSQPSGPIFEPGVFSPHFSTDLTFPNSNLALGVYHPSTAQGGIFLPSSSNPNGEQHLSRQVMELTSALAQQTTLVNQLLQRTEIQRAPDEVSRGKSRTDEELIQQRPGKQPQTEHTGSVHSRLGP